VRASIQHAIQAEANYIQESRHPQFLKLMMWLVGSQLPKADARPWWRDWDLRRDR